MNVSARCGRGKLSVDLIYLVVGEGEYAPMSEADVRSQLEQGQISPETYFWKEGMPDWLPLTQLPARPESVQPTKPKPPPPVIEPQKPLHVCSRAQFTFDPRLID